MAFPKWFLLLCVRLDKAREIKSVFHAIYPKISFDKDTITAVIKLVIGYGYAIAKWIVQAVVFEVGPFKKCIYCNLT